MNTINTSSYINKNEISRDELNEMIKKGEIEAYSQEDINKFLKSVQDNIQKGEENTHIIFSVNLSSCGNEYGDDTNMPIASAVMQRCALALQGEQPTFRTEMQSVQQRQHVSKPCRRSRSLPPCQSSP
jgi:hypothetical protein